MSRPGDQVAGLTYDTGALLAAGVGDRRVWRLHRRALERGHAPVVPAAVLAHACSGPAARPSSPASSSAWSPDLLAGFLYGCGLEVLDEALARHCALLLNRAGTADVAAASVVVGATRRRDLVITSNVAGLRRLARSVGAQVAMIAVLPDG